MSRVACYITLYPALRDYGFIIYRLPILGRFPTGRSFRYIFY